MKNKILEKSVFIIDGSSFLYRAYYGLRPLHTSNGIAVHAVYGFCRMIKKVIDTFGINHLVVVWDSKGTTHRHEMHSEYKATRQAPPSDIFEQKKLIQEFIDLVGIASLSRSSVEADDLMYSFALKLSKYHYQAVIVSSDKDMRQALSENIIIFDPFKEIVMDVDACEKRYGFPVEKLPFYFSILGDVSDNIPGIKGIGEKGASQLVNQFKSLDDMYSNVDLIEKLRTRDLVIGGRDKAFLSLKLFLLQEFEVNLSADDVVFDVNNWQNSLSFFKKLEFKSLVKEVEFLGDQCQKSEMLPLVLPKQLHEKYDFILVNNAAQLINLCATLKVEKAFAVDTETTGLDPMQAQLVGISIACRPGQAFYIPIAHTLPAQQLSLLDKTQTPNELVQLPLSEIKLHLGKLLADEAMKKYMHNAKYDQLILMQAGFEVKNIAFDTMIAASLVTKEWEKNGLKDLSQQFFQETMLAYKDVIKTYGVTNFSEIPLLPATQYAAADAHQTLKLVPVFKQMLKEQGLEGLYFNIELKTNDVLVAMQQEGIICDRNVLYHLSAQVDNDLSKIEQEIHAIAGQKINLNSPKQVRELLFEQLKLRPGKKNTKSASYSTDVEVLTELAFEHEVPKLMLVYRELYKLKSTYIDALPTYINKVTGRIHTSWNQTIAATGRLSSSNPNLQNIPRSSAYDVDIRSAFKAKEGWAFVSADYSQIELRILAHLSGDGHLKSAFLSHQDIHAQIAAKIFNIKESEVSEQQRSIGKRLNFSILYGLTAYGLAKDMHVSYGEAKKYIELYFEQYPGVLAWMDQTVEFVKKYGYVSTLYGRRRYLPGIYEKNKTLFDLARRMAINTPAQGAAAEITKLGMIAVYHALIENGMEAKILLQIHDELLVTCPQSEVVVVSKILEEKLMSAVVWEFPLTVSIRTGLTWKDVTK